MPKLDPKIKVLVCRRAAIKHKLAGAFSTIETDESYNNLGVCKDLISDSLSDIACLDNEINDLYVSNVPEESEELPSDYTDELDTQLDYSLTVKRKLAALAALQVNEESKPQVKDASDCRLKLPELNIDPFSGEGSSNLEFHSFLSKFNNVVGFRSNLSKSTKLTYLKNYLTGYAYKITAHLQIDDGNYDVAMNLLEKEFLNKEALIDDLFSKLLELKPETDRDFLKTKIFINDVKCIISDLSTYKCDLLGNHSSMLFISHLVFHKLPYPFKQELTRRIN